MSTDQKPKATPRDAVELARQAIQRVNDLEETVEEQAETIQRQQEQIERLQAALPERQEYDQLDKQTKIGMVREHVVKRAQDNAGKAKIDYQGVKWEVFDGEPSPYHCYELMEQAGTADGFDYQEPANENKRLTVNMSQKNGNAAKTDFLHENKRDSHGGA